MLIQTAIPPRVHARAGRSLLALLCSAFLPAPALLLGQTPPPPPPPVAAQAATAEPMLPPDQLDSLVAPIALYPDALLGQVLVASTYPLEVIQLQQWLAKNTGLKDKALADAVSKQPWDPSIQALAALPDAVKRLSEDIAWTTSLGNAFLAQQGDVMDAIQRMRRKAQASGALKTSEQQMVETKVVEEKTVIVVQQANPEVIYVPSYNPTVVYGPPIYAYPPIYYPPPPPAGAVMVGFAVGVMMTAAWHGGPPYGCGWGHSNTIVVNHHNTYVRHNNVHNVNRGNTNWNHNPQHRGGAPYASASTANRYGGTASGARQQPAGARPQAGASNWAGPSASTSNWVGPSGSQSNLGARPGPSTSTLESRPSPSTGNFGARPSAGPSTANRSSPYAGGGGGDRVGSRSISSSGASRSGFGGGSDGFSGRSANASRSRGASSFGSRGGGGASFGARGGGGRGR